MQGKFLCKPGVVHSIVQKIYYLEHSDICVKLGDILRSTACWGETKLQLIKTHRLKGNTRLISQHTFLNRFTYPLQLLPIVTHQSKHLKGRLGPAFVTVLDQRGPPWHSDRHSFRSERAPVGILWGKVLDQKCQGRSSNKYTFEKSKVQTDYF